MNVLHQQFSLFEHFCNGNLGISAIHLPSNISIDYRSKQQFLLCSTYKLPIACCLLDKVIKQDLNLSDLYDITSSDLRPGMISTLNSFNYDTPVKISLLNLMQLMLQESCNSATDYILKILGGPSVVMAYLKKIGIEHLSIDRTTLEVMAAWDGLDEKITINSSFSLETYKKLSTEVEPIKLEEARKLFKDDFRDRGTPIAMTQLLLKIFNHEILSADYAELLFKIMRRCKIGASRIMGLLPSGTSVAHKTGTLQGYTNDVGIIYLPRDAGTVLLSVFVEHPVHLQQIGERVIAEVARTVYDYALFKFTELLNAKYN